MLDPELTIQRLTEYSDEIAAEIGALMPELYPENSDGPVAREQMEAIIASPNSDILLALKAGQLVGKATVNLIITEVYAKAHLDNFVTRPDVRGQGVGAALWEELILWAREKGAAKITLVTDRENAIGFYKRRGATKRPDDYYHVLL